MIDDDELAELFRTAAAGEGPPPAFDHVDVVTTSRRITARRRAALTGGLGVLAVVGIGAAVLLPRATETTSTAAAPFSTSDSAREAAPAPAAAPADTVGAAGQDAAAEAPPFAGVPLGPGNGPCADRQDPALRALVEQVLPEVAGASAAATTDVCAPAGERAVAVGVEGGSLTVTYLPPGAVPSVPVGVQSAVTASGGTVIVSSRPAAPGGPVPFDGRLDTATAFLAARL